MPIKCSIQNSTEAQMKEEICLRCVCFTTKKTINILEQSMNCYRINPYFIRKTNSIQNFETALAMCNKLPYKNAWSYYIGEAWSRHVDSLQKLSSHDGISRHADIAEATCKAMEIFFQILNMKEDMEKKNRYVSRSLAQIGHILIKRSKILDRMKTDYTFLKDKSYLEFHENPMIPLEKAYKMQMGSPDSFILNRYGRALFNLAMKQNCKEKVNILKNAEHLLSTSILCYTMNWFAYSTRMQVMDELGNLYLKQYNTKLAWDCFDCAMNDGHKCFLAKGFSTDMVILAKICQKMSKFPNVRNFGGTFVKDKHYLYTALGYLNHGIASEGLHDCQLASQMASCLYDLNEYNSATEWMKRTLALAIKPNAFMYKITCLYGLKRYGYERKESKKYYYLLKEIVYIFLDCKKKCGKLETIYKYIVRNSCPELFVVLTDAITIPNLLRLDGFEIIKDLLKFATKPDSMEHKLDSVDAKRFRDLQEQVCEKDIRKHVLEDTEKDPEEIFQYSMAPIPMSINTSLVSEGYHYDFFISHSQKDSDWVYNKLLCELENKVHEEDFAFKGCIADRDFQPGKTIINNIIDAIKKSYKIILVLTKSFVQSRWCTHEMERAIFRHIGNEDCVIPLLLEPLEEAEIPDCLKLITYSDYTDERNQMQEIRKLKKALLVGGHKDSKSNERTQSN